MSCKIYVNITTRLILEVAKSSVSDLDAIISDMDYNFSSQTDGVVIHDTEIINHEIIKHEYSESRYIAPEIGVYKTWFGCEREGYKPNAHQNRVIAAVQSALDANLFYTDDVIHHCKKLFDLSQEQATEHTNGGNFEMECHYARKFIRANNRHKENCLIRDQLQLHVGQEIGNLIFIDYKRIANCVVIGISENGSTVEITGKRGAYQIKLSYPISTIKCAIDRAFEKKFRKDTFESFVSSISAKSTLI